MTADTRFQHHQYVIRRKILTLIGAAFHVFDQAGKLVLYSRQKAFRLREDLRLFTAKDQRDEVLRIKARQMIDFGATYEVIDSHTDQLIGSLRRRGFKSMLRDQWTLLDPQEREIGNILEDDAGLAILRRVVDIITLFIPQEYHIQSGNQTIGQYRRRRNPFVHRVEVNLAPAPSAGSDGHIDRRLALAGGLLLCAIEGRQG